MGRNCCCDWRMSDSMYIDMVNKTTTIFEADPDGCTCDWNNWVSRYDWPPERKNKDKHFSEPLEDGKYLVRVQTMCGDRYEDIQSFSQVSRTVSCGYTGKEFKGTFIVEIDEEQPYAWRELEGSEDEKI